MAGMEDIIGRTSHNSLKNRFEHFNIKYLKPLLLKDKPQTRETSILTVLSRLNIRDAMHHITSHGTFLGPLVVSDSALSNGVEPERKVSSVSLDENEVCFSPPSTVVDIHSVEAVYSKKDMENTRMHHMLEDAMFRPRKTFVMEKRHTVEEADTHTQQLSRHQAHQQLRRLVSLEMQRHQQLNSVSSPDKLHTLSAHDTAVTTDEVKVPPHDTAVTTDEVKVPPHDTAVTTDEVKVPPHDTAVTTDEVKVPPHDTAVTTDEVKVPPKEKCVLEAKEEERQEEEEAHEKKEEEEEEDVRREPVTFTVGAPVESKVTSLDSGASTLDDDVAASPPEETEAERVLPWKRTTQLPPVRSSMSLSMPDDDHPLMSQAPSWADNLAYNHLTESGSPYVSPENTIGAPAPSSHRRPVFDIFPPTPDAAASPPTSKTSPSDDDKLDYAHDPLPPPWTSPSSLPLPWASESSDEPPLTSPEAHDVGGGEKLTTYLQSSSHNFYPPSHHNCLVSQEEVGEDAPPSGASVRLRPAHSPKHFQPLQLMDLCSRDVIEEEIIADEADYQERLVTRVQSWLDSSEPSDEDHDFEELNPVGGEGEEGEHNDSMDDIDIDDLHIDTYL